MKFLIDEDLSYKLTSFLTKFGHTSIHIREIKLSLKDTEILKIAVEKGFIVLTFDKDFGELIFKEGKVHTGVIFLRLEDQTNKNVIRVLTWLFSAYPENNYENNFITVTEREGKFKARFGKD